MNASLGSSEMGTVFISYSHDSADHATAVLHLSDTLRSNGIDCVLDQYEVCPPEGWPKWMEREIGKAQFVLLVCTEIYRKRVMGEEVADSGLGVKWESNLIYQHIYNAGAENSKFVPVFLKKADKDFIPLPLQSTSHFYVGEQVGLDALCNRLLNIPRAVKPPLGKQEPLPPREVRTDVALFLAAPIDIELWDDAKWRGTFYLGYEGQIPVLGLAFAEEKMAKRIFEGWHIRYGDNDEFEELRISIVEGEVEGEEAGYTVHIGPDWDNLLEQYKKYGFRPQEDGVLMVSRIHRMNPAPNSRSLEMFKHFYRRFKSYKLVPGLLSTDNQKVKPFFDLAIHKRNVFFRHVEEIGENDPDTVVLNSGSVDRPRWR